MTEKDIKIGERVWFKDKVETSNWYYIKRNNPKLFINSFSGPTCRIKDIREHKGEKYLIVSTGDDCEWAIKFTELQEKGLLLPENTFKIGDKVEPINQENPLQLYLYKDGEIIPGNTVSSHTYTDFIIKDIQGEYIQDREQVYIWFKKSDFQKAEQAMNNKPSFTVEGSVPLRRALVEELQESGMKVCATIERGDMYRYPYLFTGEGVIGVTKIKKAIHYTLPEDWNTAIAAFKDYFKKEFKVGDIVMVGGRDYNNGDEFIAEVVIAGTNDYWVKNPGDLKGVYSNKNLYKKLCVSTQINRLATKEEIEQYKEQQEEKIVVAGYEMKVIEIEKDIFGHKKAKFCDQLFTIEELNTIRKLAMLRNYVIVNIRIGETKITPELLDKIISKLS